MTPAIIKATRQRILQYLLFLGTVAAVVVGLAQTGEQPSHKILINGKAHPDEIPENILWEQLFRMAIQLNEMAPADSEELWMKRLNFSQKTMNEIIAQSYEHKKMLDEMGEKAKEQKTKADNNALGYRDHPNKKDALKSKLIEIQLDRDSRTLEMRDQLRERIGEDAFLRLTSFVRLQIAPKTIVGN